jgi:TatA/E family protein of Tat protein translocase
MLSIPHLIIIFVVALVVFGPEKLPDLARNLGKVLSEFKRATGDLRSTLEGHLRDLERETEQRRIATSPSAASGPEPSPVPPAPGTVPTTPPHTTGAPEDEFPSEEPSAGGSAVTAVSADDSAVTAVSADDSSMLDPLRCEVPEQPKKSEPEHDSEIVSNGGHRPA